MEDDLGDFFSEINQIDEAVPSEQTGIKADNSPFQGTISSSFIASKKKVIEVPIHSNSHVSTNISIYIYIYIYMFIYIYIYIYMMYTFTSYINLFV
jgi:hypothetical protein